MGISTLLCWSVTQGEYISGKDEDRSLVSGLRQPRYSLEERFTGASTAVVEFLRSFRIIIHYTSFDVASR